MDLDDDARLVRFPPPLGRSTEVGNAPPSEEERHDFAETPTEDGGEATAEAPPETPHEDEDAGDDDRDTRGDGLGRRGDGRADEWPTSPSGRDLEKAMGVDQVAKDVGWIVDEKADDKESRDDEGEEESVVGKPESDQQWRLAEWIGLARFGIPFWGTVLVVPNLFILLVLLIPLGDPHAVFDKHGAWPFLFFVNPLIMSALVYLHLTPYWGCHGDERPFTVFPEKCTPTSPMSDAHAVAGAALNHISVPIMVLVYMLEVAIVLPLVVLFGFFSFIGLVSLAIAFLLAFSSTAIVWVILSHMVYKSSMCRHLGMAAAKQETLDVGHVSKVPQSGHLALHPSGHLGHLRDSFSQCALRVAAGAHICPFHHRLHQ